MGFRFSFRTVESSIERTLLEPFLRAQALDYKNPDYQDWVSKTMAELRQGTRFGVIAMSDGRIVGNLVYKEHDSLPGTVELRNMRIHPQVQGRSFASFLIAQAETHARNNGLQYVLGDVRADRTDVLDLFLRKLGYSVLEKGVSLYGDSREDVVMIRDVTQEPFWVYSRGIIRSS